MKSKLGIREIYKMIFEKEVQEPIPFTLDKVIGEIDFDKVKTFDDIKLILREAYGGGDIAWVINERKDIEHLLKEAK